MRAHVRGSRRILAIAAVMLAGCAAPSITPTAGESPPMATQEPSRHPSTASSTSPQPSLEPSAPLAPAWAELEVDGPAGREDHTWTVSADGTIAYLFGGRDGATVMGDLWAYDLATDAWTPVEVDGGPAARFGHEAVWMDGIGVVIFAGQSGPTFFDDLWAFDPGTTAWRQLPSGGDVPVARYGSCAAIGPDGRLWISHGFTSDGTRFADTKAYDFAGGSWTDETPAGDLPVNRCLHGCWWTDDGHLALFGGQTTGVTALDDRWLLADGGWQRGTGVVPPARNLYARARLDGATLILGGQGIDGGRLDDGWLLHDGDADASPLAVQGVGPPGRSGAELIVDEARDRILLFGGLGADGVFADTWELVGDPLAGA
ncbi:MAG TPA: kelch repeat-containing protein [Candidatus Limnocylindria bacterium]